jgi:RHS repeat-associated protein
LGVAGLTSHQLLTSTDFEPIHEVIHAQKFTEYCFGSPFTFTGELIDANALLYLRARYYHPALGVFTGLDPVEGSAGQNCPT